MNGRTEGGSSDIYGVGEKNAYCERSIRNVLWCFTVPYKRNAPQRRTSLSVRNTESLFMTFIVTMAGQAQTSTDPASRA